MDKIKFGIVIPIRNNAYNIKSLYGRFSSELKNINYFVCFVDGSDDNKTRVEINNYFKKNFIIINEKKSEQTSTRCRASRMGFEYFVKKKTNIDYIIDLDSDLAQDPKDINKSLFFIKKNTVIIFSKYLKKSKILNRVLYRSFISFFYNQTCKFFFGKKISDYSNSFRIYPKLAIIKLLEYPLIYSSPIQHLENILILKKFFRIKEIPCIYNSTDNLFDQRSAIKLRHLIYYLKDFISCIYRNSI
jgi:hypothetical protein